MTNILSRRAFGGRKGGRDGVRDESRDESRKKTLEMVAVIVLSITSILTAWSAFQASKWGGAMSIAFSTASSARIESSTFSGKANATITNQVGLWTQWAAATSAGDTRLATFLSARFPEPLATAHRDWLAAGGATAGAPASPFDMPSYIVPAQEEANALSDKAGEWFQTALRDNQRGDNYTLLTVLFAAVLFFAAMSGRPRAILAQQLLLFMAIGFGLAGTVLLATYPKLV